MSTMNTEKWEHKFTIATAYYKEFGHLNVPDKFLYKGINLGNWIYLQRKNYREGKLNSNQIERLNAINMVWDVLEEDWERKYALAKRFYEANGSLLIPVTQQYENTYLGKWISHQRQSFAKGKLSQTKIERLEEIGMIWDVSKSNIASSFPEQALFFYLSKIYPDAVNRHTDYNCEIDIFIPSIKTGIEYDGFAWHQDLKKDLTKNKKLQKHGIKVIRIREKGCPQLPTNENCIVFDINRSYTDLYDVLVSLITHLFGTCEIDIDLVRDQMQITANYINIYNSQWERMYQIAKNIYEQTGTLPIGTNSELGTWLSHQRQRYKHHGVALTSDQIQKLNELGMVWEPHKDLWYKMYTIAVKYYAEKGNLDVTTNQMYENENLGSWISSQRTKYKANKLSIKRIALLNQIGMIWDAQVDYDKCWEDMFLKAKDYYQKHGNLRVNTRNSALGKWINSQRTAYSKGELKKDRIEKLNSICMVWDIYEADWEAMYCLAEQYFIEHKHLNIGAKEKYKGQNLGMWVKRQCDGKENLTSAQTYRLECIGIVWRRNETKWAMMYQLAKSYYELNGDLLVNTHSLFQGERLGQWINKQRTDYMNRGTQKENAEFTEERITDLEAIGMVWDVNNYKWNRMYDVAKRYYNLYGHLEVPAAQEFEGIKLGKWLSNQRSSYRGYKGRKTLTADQIEKLNELNFKW